jgi:DNA-binding LytR/AlgR family response regulator
MSAMALDRILLHLDPNGDPSGDASSDHDRSGDDDARRVRRAVDPADVYALEADGGDTLVRLRGREPLRDTRPLAELAPIFEPFGFLQIHRSHAVNLRRVLELRQRAEGHDWEVKLEPPVNAVLPVAREWREAVLGAFG